MRQFLPLGKFVLLIAALDIIVWSPGGVLNRLVEGGDISTAVAKYLVIWSASMAVFLTFHRPGAWTLNPDSVERRRKWMKTLTCNLVFFGIGAICFGTLDYYKASTAEPVQPRYVYITKTDLQKVRKELGLLEWPIGTRFKDLCTDCKIPEGSLGTIVGPPINDPNCTPNKVTYTVHYDGMPESEKFCSDPRQMVPISFP